jgi:hypothetical protein
VRFPVYRGLYFQPQFQSIQTSSWFIVERRRSLEWMQRVAKGARIFSRLRGAGRCSPMALRAPPMRARAGAARSDDERGWHNDTLTNSETDATKEWTILEQRARHGLEVIVRGRAVRLYCDFHTRMTWTAIAFTELVLIDDPLTIRDSRRASGAQGSTIAKSTRAWGSYITYCAPDRHQ